MGKNKGAKQSNEKSVAVPLEIEPVPGFFGQVIKPGQALVWDNEVEEFALQLTSAALGPKVSSGRSTLFATAKDAKIALCTLVPEKTEQWNLAHLFTAYDGPVVLECEGVNEIHLTGLIDVQDEEDDHDHDHDDDDSDDDEEMTGTYSDSDEGSEVMIFDGEDDDSDEEDDEEENNEEAEKRFEVIEERVHGDAGEKKKETPKKENASTKKETPKKEATPSKKEATPSKKEATPSKKEATPSKKEATPAKKEATPAKKDTPKNEATPAKKEDKKTAKKEEKRSMAEKVAEASSTNSKKRPAPSDSVDVPKKAKSTRLYKGVTIEEVAVGKGQPVAKGRKVSILYRGRLENGKQFDANQNRKKPFIFRHGIGDVIKGMDIGIEGMRAGGKRTITIPSHLGYGKSGAPPSIPGNSTLVFEIEML